MCGRRYSSTGVNSGTSPGTGIPMICNQYSSFGVTRDTTGESSPVCEVNPNCPEQLAGFAGFARA
eukprot:3164850-Pyramimonas_sp.AAC.2